MHKIFPFWLITLEYNHNLAKCNYFSSPFIYTIMFMFWSSLSSPFFPDDVETEEGIFEQVLHGDLDFESDPWPSISESAKDLVRRMLIRDPRRRLTAHEVLCKSHSFTPVFLLSVFLFLWYMGPVAGKWVLSLLWRGCNPLFFHLVLRLGILRL